MTDRVTVIMPDVSPVPEGEVERSRRTHEDLIPTPGFFARWAYILLPAVTMVLILAVWEIYARVKGINPLFFSYPSEIWRGFVTWYQGPLFGDLKTSATEFVVGLLLGAIGIPVGLVIGSVRRLSLALDPLINGLYSTPTLALTPLFVIWFGLGLQSKVAIVTILAFFPLVINTADGVRTVDRQLVQAARSFGAHRIQLYRDVIFPGTLPFIVSGIRLAIGRAIIGVVIGEFIASVDGVGYRIRAAAASFRTAEYLAGVMVLIIFAIALTSLLKVAERRLAPWRTDE